MENEHYLLLNKGNLSKGLPTGQFKSILVKNLILCYNYYDNKEDLFKFYSKTFYGVFKDQGLVRQLSSNLVCMNDIIKLVDFNAIFEDMYAYELKINKKISIKETTNILNKYLVRNLNRVLIQYNKGKINIE